MTRKQFESEIENAFSTHSTLRKHITHYKYRILFNTYNPVNAFAVKNIPRDPSCRIHVCEEAVLNVG